MTIHTNCQGVRRRDVLKVGVFGATGLTLSQYLQMAHAGQIEDRAKTQSAIFIDLRGGPSHIDTFDPKPDAPAEFRGEFKTISTNVDGIQVCEHLPKMARCADKFSIFRGVSHSLAAHPLGQQYINTGNRPLASLQFPCFGSVVSKELPTDPDIPAFVSIPNSSHGAGYLGVQYSPLTTNQVPRAGRPFNVRGISLAGGIPLAEIQKRHQLLNDLDQTFRGMEQHNETIKGLDKFSQQAFDMITSRRSREAFDIGREAPAFAKPFGDSDFGQSCLLATRLVEAGVRFVSLTLGGWDTHQANFSRLRGSLLPTLDTGLSALLSGLERKGLLDSTTVYVTGEFGRTPKINNRDAGRDHYSRCMFMLLAGGGIRNGQVVGQSDAHGKGPAGNPIKPDDVAATFYQAIGINPHQEYHTSTGRPVMIVRDGEPIKSALAT